MRNIVFMALMLLAACSPEQQPYTSSADAHPSITDKSFVAADNASLPSRSWLPKGKPQAIVVALHGFNDYSFAFDSAGSFFKAHRIATFAYDQRGFGGSPNTGIWGGEDNLLADLRQYVELISRRYPHTPIYLMGESMGGAVAVSAAADPAFPKIKGMILVAPALWGDETMNPLFRTTLWMAAHTFPSHTVSGHDLKILATDNIPLLREMGNDPLVLKKTRIDAVYGVMQLMDTAYERAPLVKTPALILYGACDQVIPSEPITKTLEHFHAPVTFVYYPEGYHMLLRDLQGERVLTDIVSWIGKPGAKLPSGLAADTIPEHTPSDHCRHIVQAHPTDNAHHSG